MIGKDFGTALSIAMLFAFPAEALSKDFFTQARDNISDAVKTVAPIVAPGPTVVIQVLQGKKPEDAIKDAVLAPVTATIDGQKKAAAIDQQIEDQVKNALGPDAGKVIEIVRLPEKIERSIHIQLEQTAVDAVKDGKVDPAIVTTIPLAASLQQAIDLYSARSKPIPDT